MTTCQVCGDATEDDNVIILEGRRVCATCKPRFLQELKECSLAPLPVPPIEVAEHELTLQSLVGASWKIIHHDWRAILCLQLLVSIPSNWILGYFDPTEDGSLREFAHYFKAVQALEIFFGVVASLGIAQIVNARVEGRSLSFGAALFHATRRWLPGIGTSFLASIAVGFLFLLLIVPGVMFLVYYAFVIPIVALRETAGSRALKYSKTLVEGRWWRVTGRLLGLFVLPLIGACVSGVLLAFAPDSSLRSLVMDTVSDVFFCFTGVGAVVLFLNLDAVPRREPLSAITLGAR